MFSHPHFDWTGLSFIIAFICFHYLKLHPSAQIVFQLHRLLQINLFSINKRRLYKTFTRFTFNKPMTPDSAIYSFLEAQSSSKGFHIRVSFFLLQGTRRSVRVFFPTVVAEHLTQSVSLAKIILKHIFGHFLQLSKLKTYVIEHAKAETFLCLLAIAVG